MARKLFGCPKRKRGDSGRSERDVLARHKREKRFVSCESTHVEFNNGTIFRCGDRLRIYFHNKNYDGIYPATIIAIRMSSDEISIKYDDEGTEIIKFELAFDSTIRTHPPRAPARWTTAHLFLCFYINS